MNKKVIIITGSSRGIGYHIAINLAEKGHRVYATMRSPENSKLPDGIIVKKLDVTDSESIQKAISEVIADEGRVDVLINNAGYGLFSPVDMVSDEEVHQQFDVNVYGALRVIRAVLPQMRKQKLGQIINISSLAGITSNMGMGVYCASKHALEALSQSLAATLSPWNISVSVVEPGAVATEFADDMHVAKALKEENPYRKFASRYLERMKEMIPAGQPPEEIAVVVANIIESKTPSFRYQTNERTENIASQFIVDRTGDQWITDQKEKFGDWFQ